MVAKVGAHLHDLQAGDELDAVAPVGADIGHGARFAAELRHEPPVPVGRQVEPVLRVGAGGVKEIAELTRLHHRLGFLDERIIAVVEIDRVHHAGLGGELDQFLRLLRRHRQRLFGNHMFARRHDLLADLEMHVVGRAVVDDLDFLVGEERVHAAVGFRDVELGGFRFRAIRRWPHTARAFPRNPAAARPRRAPGR